KRSSILMTVSLGAALGMLFFIIVLNIRMIDPTQINWLMYGDKQWHFMGSHFFIHESWNFPIIGKITGIYFPIGTSIGLTDSIPLFALIFKPFTALLPNDFQYIGLWLFTCFALQGVFAALLIRLRSKNIFIIAIGALFFILSPVLLARINHLALCAHWLLLAGLWLYFRTWNSKPLWSWLFFISLSAFIHPYLTVMMLGLATAFYARLWLIERSYTAISALGQLLLLASITLFIWWILGYFLVTNQSNMAGYTALGHYSMNLLSLFNPMGWSMLLKNIPLATEGQYEGFNYLGIGVFLMGFWAIYELLSRKAVRTTTLKKLLPLGIICIIFTLFAISNKVTIGNIILIDYQSDLLNILTPFQSSGRFFWPVNYLILFLVISLLIVRNKPRIAIIYLSFALTIQVLDSYEMYRSSNNYHREANFYSWENPLKSPYWDEKLSANVYQNIALIPPHICEKTDVIPYLPFSLLAGRYGMTINSGIAARTDIEKIIKYCQTSFADMRQGKVTDDTVYIVHPSYLDNFKQTAIVCAKIDGFNACVTENSLKKWQ
ncbi:MAG: DUF6311 domain-containing protein, partial [Candidatus Marithrix sp.]